MIFSPLADGRHLSRRSIQTLKWQAAILLRRKAALNRAPEPCSAARVAFAKKQLLADHKSAPGRRHTTKQEASMFTRVLAIGTACIFIAATAIWSAQRAVGGDTGGIKGKSAVTSAPKSRGLQGKRQQKRWTSANFK
jgi:hypothetical protein